MQKVLVSCLAALLVFSTASLALRLGGCSQIYIDVGQGTTTRLQQLFSDIGTDKRNNFLPTFEYWFGDLEQRKQKRIEGTLCSVAFSVSEMGESSATLVYDNVTLSDRSDESTKTVDVAEWFRNEISPLQADKVVLGIGNGVNIGPVLGRLTNSGLFCFIDQTVLAPDFTFSVPSLSSKLFITGISYFWDHRGNQCDSTPQDPVRLVKI